MGYIFQKKQNIDQKIAILVRGKAEEIKRVSGKWITEFGWVLDDLGNFLGGLARILERYE